MCVAYKLTTHNGHGQSGWSPIACDFTNFVAGLPWSAGYGLPSLWIPFWVPKMEASQNGGTLKSSIQIRFYRVFHYKTIQLLGYLHFKKPPMFSHKWAIEHSPRDSDI